MIRTLRILRWASLGLIGLLVVAVAVLELRPHGVPAGNSSAEAASVPVGISIGGPFHLIDDKGHAVTDADYRGRWMLVFFGCRAGCFPPTGASSASATTRRS